MSDGAIVGVKSKKRHAPTEIIDGVDSRISLTLLFNGYFLDRFELRLNLGSTLFSYDAFMAFMRQLQVFFNGAQWTLWEVNCELSSLITAERGFLIAEYRIHYGEETTAHMKAGLRKRIIVAFYSFMKRYIVQGAP